MASDSNSRFTRRKQLNPRRKNADPESMGPEEGLLSHSAASVGDDEETLEEPEDRLVIDAGSPAPASPVPAKERPSPRNGFHRLLLEHPLGSLPSSGGGDPLSSPPSSPPARLNGHLNLSEAEKIREYLGRSDTAVIFPEPVDIAEPKREQGERPSRASSAASSTPPGLPCAIPLASESELAEHCRRPPPPPPREGATDAADSSAERLHACGKCKAAFSQRAHLERHQAGHAAQAPAAPVSNNQRHMLSHDESSVLRKFKCPECGKAFKFKHHLKEHIRIHSGEKPFACPNCGKRFSHSGSYSSHMTSKKCLVVNLKVRKIDVKSSRGRSSAPSSGNGLTINNNNSNNSSSNNNNNAFRPIIPKYGASPEPAASYLSDRFPFPVVGEGQALQPFLPAYASVNFHTLLASHFQGLPPYVPFPGFPDMASLLQQGLHPSQCKEDPSPYSGRAPSPPPVRQHPDHGGRESNPEQQPLGSALNAVKKILQIVDATVSKQRLDARLSPAPVVSYPASPTRAEVKEDAPTPTGSPSRCRFCDEPFESNIDLHQHERYLCKLNRDRPASKEEEEEDDAGRDVHNGHAWTPPRRLLVQSEERNGPSSPPPPEDVKPSCDDLKALLSAHPRPKKGELLKATREMGYPMKAIQGWFRRRPQERTPSPPPIQVPVYKPYAALAGEPPSAHPSSPRKSETPSPSPLVPDQPLDLSVKAKPTAAASLSPFTADGALNLSHKSSRLGLKDEEDESRRHWSSPLLLPRAAPADSLTDSLAQRLQRNGFLGGLHGGRSSLSPADSESHSTSDSVRGDFPPDYHPKYLHGNAVLALGSGGGPLVVQRSPNRFPYPEEARPGSSSDPASCSPSPDGCLPHTELLMHGKAPFLAGDYDDAEQRRIFKKLWKQDELDESGMGSLGVGCEDVSSGDLLDDLQGAKRRKSSWKASPLQGAVPNCKLEADEGVYSCDQCDKTFSKQSSLARHKYEHSGQRPHKCDVCSKAFKHKHHLTEHKRLHSGEKPFQCQKCLKRFSHSGSYSQHMNHRYSYCKPYRE